MHHRSRQAMAKVGSEREVARRHRQFSTQLSDLAAGLAAPLASRPVGSASATGDRKPSAVAYRSVAFG